LSLEHARGCSRRGRQAGPRPGRWPDRRDVRVLRAGVPAGDPDGGRPAGFGAVRPSRGPADARRPHDAADVAVVLDRALDRELNPASITPRGMTRASPAAATAC